jgi:hypothetical protein
MKTGLEHLPPAKRRELERVVEILFAEFQDAIVLGMQAHKRLGRILKVILDGSRARGAGSVNAYRMIRLFLGHANKSLNSSRAGPTRS